MKAFLFQASMLLIVISLSSCKEVDDSDQIPRLTQLQDFTSVYTGRDTDIISYTRRPGIPPLPKIWDYDELQEDHAVGHPILNGKRWVWGFKYFETPTNPRHMEHIVKKDRRKFHGLLDPKGETEDWVTITNGHMHCSPTAVAMLLSYWSNVRGITGVTGGRSSGDLIRHLAQIFDTNDQNPAMHRGDQLGHFGTNTIDMYRGLIRHLRNSGGGFRVNVKNFNFTLYQAQINANQPVIISFRNPGANIGHTVLGIGYLNKYGMQRVVFLDPFSGSKGSIRASNITRAVRKNISRTDGAPVPIESSKSGGQWVDTVMIEVSHGTPITPVTP